MAKRNDPGTEHACRRDAKDIRRCLLPYFFTAGFVILILAVLTYVLKIYPFGNNTYLWDDADQYLGVEHYFGSLTGKNDMFYSWENVLGGNVLSQLAYYAFSPFNVIFMLLKGHMILAAHLTAYLKILAASLTFCFGLTYLYKDEEHLIKALLSACYAFMGYMVFFGWNISWMDGVILLPLMFVGIHRIVRRKDIILYVLSLAAALISNFYIGFMMCIGSFIFYIALTVLAEDGFPTAIKKTFPKYVFASVIGAGCSAFVFLPTYLSISAERKLSVMEMLSDMHFTIGPSYLLSGLFSGQVNNYWNNAPIIYVGIFALVMDILFFVCRKNPVRKKIVGIAVILVFLFSFENSFVNTVWHGMSSNSCFNYRYSFLFCFVLLMMAYEAYRLIREKACSKREYIFTGIIFLLIAGFVFWRAREKTQTALFCADIIFAAVILLLLILWGRKKRVFNAVLACGILLSLIGNGYVTLKDLESYTVNAYEGNLEIMEDAYRTIDDDSFYRMDKSFGFGRSDANLYGYNGISNYASTENLDNLEFLRKLGVQHTWMWAEYTTDVPMATESLLGLKYILTSSSNGKDYEEIGSCGSITYYKNPYALPILFSADSIQDIDTENENDFEILNSIWRSVNGIDEDVFTEDPITIDSSGGQYTLDVSVVKDGPVYLCIPEGSYSLISVSGLSEEKEIIYDSYSDVYYIGECSTGDQLELTVTVSGDDYDLNGIVCCTENSDVIRENAEIVNGQDISIEEVSSSHLEMTYTGEGKLIATTIPYDEGWKIYDNGKPVETEKNWSNFVAFRLDDSESHNIRLVFRPVGFGMGLTASLVCAALLPLYEICSRLYIGRKGKRTGKTEIAEA